MKTHRYGIIGVLGFVLLFAVCSKDPVGVVGEADDFGLKMAQWGLEFTIVDMQGYVKLTWNPVQENPAAGDTFHFYRVYRTTQQNPEGGADTASMVSTGIRRFIEKDKQEFFDIPALISGIYFYSMSVVTIKDWNGVLDTIEGPRSDIKRVTVGANVSFNISFGDISTVTDKVNLVLNDPVGMLEWVQFSQIVERRWTKLSGESVVIDNSYSPHNFPGQEQVAQWVEDGYIYDKNGSLQTGITDNIQPDFNADDAFNTRRYYPLDLSQRQNGQRYVFNWTLLKGNGVKTVYARFKYRDEHGGIIDTVKDDIQIAPYRIELNFRNKVNSADATMRFFGRGLLKYYIYKPWMKFSVSIFADTTVNTDFHYWLAVADSFATVDPLLKTPRDYWLETPPVSTSLTGVGPAHDDEKLYEYNIDTTVQQTRDRLTYLTRTKQLFVDADYKPALQLFGSDQFNEYAVPGSYWGISPRKWDGSYYAPRQEQISGQPGEVYRRVMKLDPAQEFLNGAKEVVLIARFTGKYFNDVRTVVSGGDLYPASGRESYFDLFAPTIVFDPPSSKDVKPNWLTNDCTVTGVFNYALSKSPSVWDKGGADIEDVQLVIARKPEEFAWNYGTPQSVAANITIDQMRQFPHFIYDYNIKITSYVLKEVEWEDIDASSWPTGQYIMGIFTRDKYGNEGFAQVGSKSAYSNPWMVNVLSGM